MNITYKHDVLVELRITTILCMIPDYRNWTNFRGNRVHHLKGGK